MNRILIPLTVLVVIIFAMLFQITELKKDNAVLTAICNTANAQKADLIKICEQSISSAEFCMKRLTEIKENK